MHRSGQARVPIPSLDQSGGFPIHGANLPCFRVSGLNTLRTGMSFSLVFSLLYYTRFSLNSRMILLKLPCAVKYIIPDQTPLTPPVVEATTDHARWNLPEGALARLGKSGILAVAYSPDGTLLAVASWIGIWLYDAGTGAEVALLSGHTGYVGSVAFSPDGTTLASGSRDSTVVLWDVASRQRKATFQAHANPVTTVAFSPDGTTLAGGSWDARVVLWDVASGQEIFTLQAHTRGGFFSGVFAGRDYPCQWKSRLHGCVVGCGQRAGEGHPQRAFAFGQFGGVFSGWGHPDQWGSGWQDCVVGCNQQAVEGHPPRAYDVC